MDLDVVQMALVERSCVSEGLLISARPACTRAAQSCPRYDLWTRCPPDTGTTVEGTY